MSHSSIAWLKPGTMTKHFILFSFDDMSQSQTQLAHAIKVQL
jgi:hypothetical protein